ncbi:hypothetical protein CV_1192 [Chromobacterium violaceum ATCC 12472]|uniref:Uncharacterized protein n=1 Tax=Chromobacterium violaceum (strain ATCC 12472 / DSM 30191 / JCM 1249 / CCUG 213 / NBRC 12614 / NCIMB 9131 / NCTC 9757 / MK) TaxID=243365 RepID=Q7NYT0_CHRVO|nr:hypothetical protein CV_1192 [Chromobacterium violaceum ATCC 12472]
MTRGGRSRSRPAPGQHRGNESEARLPIFYAFGKRRGGHGKPERWIGPARKNRE